MTFVWGLLAVKDRNPSFQVHGLQACQGQAPVPRPSPWSPRLRCLSAGFSLGWAVSAPPSQQVHACVLSAGGRPAAVPRGLPNTEWPGMSHLCRTGQQSKEKVSPNRTMQRDWHMGALPRPFQGTLRSVGAKHVNTRGACPRIVPPRTQPQ